MQYAGKSWLPNIDDAAGPKYLSISGALARDVAEGRLRAGDRLPPQRDLAEALSVDLGTVTRAYAEARRLGLIDADGRRGSFVREPALTTISTEVAPFDTGMNLPPIPHRSTLASRYTATLQAVLEGPAAANRLQYQPSGGAPVDRAAGAAWLAQRGIEAAEETVLVVSGGQTALHAIAGAALNAGDAVCTGPFVYPGWLAMARRMGLRLVPLPADREGIDPAALEDACRGHAVKALYVVPTNDNPTTATLGIDRRQELAAIAQRYDLQIIEDDAYGQLASAAMPPLATLAPERTWHVASLSKIISPALRIAYLRVPSLRDAWRLAAEVHEATVMAPPLNAAVASAWLESGVWRELVAEVRAECTARQAIVRSILPEGSHAADPEGYHLWVPLSANLSPAALATELASAGLSIVPSDVFAANQGDGGRAVRISIGGNLGRERLARGLEMLDALLHHRGGRGLPLV